ncbi:MAG: bifunctional nuclease family protein [Chloroherpetonaceae bacterium]|nr:bifunctional nuclease family protein [Chloroherpetonaceae bacterium]
MKKIQVDILGLSTSPHNQGAYALILFEIGGKRKLPIIIGGFEAQAIALKLENIKAPRPFTHDLIRSLTETFSITVSEVMIDELRNETFYAKVVCELSGMIHEIDARPSDAIALAVRCDAPIFVSEEVMNEAGIIDEKGESQSGFGIGVERKSGTPALTTPAPNTNKLDELNIQLKEAIQQEDYEKAARIRDEIKKLGGEAN